ncbi:TLC domain-containing protein 2 [Cynara cardunculus var. scolymus]|uniref:TRAM/LAG1/CLN8 homology domain-containing protein n=1 Tax=Cynara cardunculus var. scolymus TaxID=59895 RepID=A0A118JZ15_CYNCS|nr:TLC domain-containing protein 2 [Cynara cardunculus var. scolymus]XP_024972559.1 TLC domain-containing protein 2 [Cynara cardunculus var. scolymus]KVH98727.1 TRAM/LAG1/CLN8 homology domain-containing protein [Cynara cardunculus var. scolymus]
MAGHLHKKNDASAFFFMATLVMWAVSVFFEILFNKRTELFPLLTGFCFYQFANWVCRTFISRNPLLVNTCVSLLHSSLTSASVVFILVNELISNGWDELFEHSKLVKATWPWAYSALCISCGYFAYDQLDMLLYGLYSGWIPSILLHHFILLGCFTLALYRNVTINYLILTLICELHSIFLHVRKVRRMAGFRDSNSKFVKIEWFLNMVTFFLARLLSHLLITIKLVKDAAKFEKGVELPLALLGMAGMNLLNVFLGVDILKALRRERNSHES